MDNCINLKNRFYFMRLARISAVQEPCLAKLDKLNNISAGGESRLLFIPGPHAVHNFASL
ncbi:hypothetical protein CAL15_23865 [Bordetella genomosp. 13]|uniref:Uncharacterized protein n=1 Tax=Bordetella genomosp. 13 TaxID=463040 RepID=A0A1W6ZIL0_9BORD|nr:hypothetical protein CAL15_23865 [Bordetella genomosp. 13]